MDYMKNFNLNYITAGALVIGLSVWHHNHPKDFSTKIFSTKRLEYILEGIPNPYQSFYENVKRELITPYIGNVEY